MGTELALDGDPETVQSGSLIQPAPTHVEYHHRGTNMSGKKNVFFN